MRHLVNLQFAQEPPHPGDPRVGVAGDTGASLRSIHDHGAELVDAEDLAVLPYAWSTVEDRTGGVELDRQRDEQVKREKGEKEKGGDQDVEHSFEHVSCVTC